MNTVNTRPIKECKYNFQKLWINLLKLNEMSYYKINTKNSYNFAII